MPVFLPYLSRKLNQHACVPAMPVSLFCTTDELHGAPALLPEPRRAPHTQPADDELDDDLDEDGIDPMIGTAAHIGGLCASMKLRGLWDELALLLRVSASCQPSCVYHPLEPAVLNGQWHTSTCMQQGPFHPLPLQKGFRKLCNQSNACVWNIPLKSRGCCKVSR